MVCQIGFNARQRMNRRGDERNGFAQAMIGLGTAESQESRACFAKTLSSQTCDSSRIVSAFEQVHRQSM
jgi:hypothetical protein